MTKKVKKLLRKKFPKFMQKKLVILYVGIILAFAGLVVKITYINASSGEEYTKIVLDQQQYDSRVIPTSGETLWTGTAPSWPPASGCTMYPGCEGHAQ